MSNNELETRCKEYRELKRMKEEIESELEAIADTIKTAIGDAETIIAGEYKIINKTVSGARLDTTAIKRELPEIASRFTIATTTKRFQIS